MSVGRFAARRLLHRYYTGPETLLGQVLGRDLLIANQGVAEQEAPRVRARVVHRVRGVVGI